MRKPVVTMRKVNKFFGSNHVVKDLDLEVREGEFLTLLGPSGCGKTTTLRMIAGFEDATSGSIMVEGERVEDKEAYERNVNTVFQNYALFPHMTVFDNIAYGLSVKKIPKDIIKKRVEEMLDLVQLRGFERRKPNALSGGQEQRVAIVRALINEPKVLLLDEPLGALDLQLRKQMQIELKRLQKKLGITFIYVTHDQEEALTMSDRIAIMNGGVLEQIGTSTEIYEKPGTYFVADFIGESNILEGRVSERKGNGLVIETPYGTASGASERFSPGDTVYVSVRPEDLEISKEPCAGFSISGTVKDFIYIGSQFKTNVSLSPDTEFRMCRYRSYNLKEGETVYMHWNVNEAVIIPRQAEKSGEQV